MRDDVPTPAGVHGPRDPDAPPAPRPQAETRRADAPRSAAPALLAAALALPGVHPDAAAQAPPERAQLDVRWLHYQDSQPGFDRIRVDSPALGLRVPVGERWSFEGAVLRDAVSGASPRWHSAVSGASRMRDERTAGDVRVTRHWDRATLALGGAASSENDYRSRALSLRGTWSSDDNGRTWSAGIGRADDRIDPVNGVVVDERRRTTDLLLGVSQVLTPVDVVQATLTHARGEGYFSDPYKALDRRPRERVQTAAQLRWNRHLAPLGATLRLGWRLYGDSWDVRSHTLTGEWVQPMANDWTLAPSLRYYTQSAASFFYGPVYDPVLGEPFPPGFAGDFSTIRSPDARLSAFGAGAIGLRVSKALDRSSIVDLRLEYYEQRGAWRVGGSGTDGLAPLRATILQLGLTYLF
jgi:hypothetical protein